eukprot:4151084-Pyramimonas_sp.AAC.1
MRAWARVRPSIARPWEADHGLPGFWGLEGKTCERADWECNAHAFVADTSSFLNGTLFTDLSKFYERVSHGQLILEALAMAMAMRLVRAACQLQGRPRVG